jgi:putative intracellular protease/amidase
MTNKAAYLLAIPGFADWEPAHALAELRRSGGYEIKVVGFDRNPVESMGGLVVQPDLALPDVDPRDVAVFILPGGDRWETTPPEHGLVSLLVTLDDVDVPIAAICGATVGVTRAGLLRSRRHTSNGLDYLREHVPEYQEAGNYVDSPAVRDRHLITATGLADVEFAAEIFAELGVFSDEDRALWVKYFRGGRLPD